MEKARQYRAPRLFYLLLTCTLSGIGLLTLFKKAPTASAANSPEHPVQNTASKPLHTTTHYTPTLQFVSSMGGDHGDIALAGDYAYVGNGAELSIMDISDPSLAHEVRLLRLPGVIYNLAVDSNYLYVAAGYGGLLIYDISAPAAPKQLARLQDDSPFYHLYPSGDLLIAVTAQRLISIDVSQPIFPQLLDEIEGDYLPENLLFVRGIYAYTGQWIIDISNPQALTITAELPGFVREINEPYALAEHLTCYAALGCDSYLYLEDISDPALPVILYEYDFPGVITAAKFEDTTLYTANDGYLVIFDISDPHTFVQLSSLPRLGICGLEVSDDRLYILASGLEILDISDPTEPVTLDDYTSNDSVLDYKHSGDVFFLRMLYEDNAHRSLHILYTANPENITVLGSAVQFSGVTWVYDFQRDGERLYLSAWAPKFQIWDFSNASVPLFLGGHNAFVYGTVSVQVTADRAYLNGLGPMKILDTSDPAQPTVLMVYPEGGYSGSYNVLSDDLVYIQAYYYDEITDEWVNRLQTVDFSAAPNYTVLGSYNPGYTACDISYIEGTPTRVYLGCLDGSIEIVETSNPASPMLTGVYTMTSVYTYVLPVQSLEISGNLLFAGSYDNLEIIDVSNPYSPTLLSRTQVSGRIEDSTVADGWAYLSMGENGLLVYDVSDPTNPVFYTRYSTPTNHVQIIGGLAYLSTGENGLQILSLFEPSVYLPYVQFNSP
jgi:hypothetical protein